MKVTVNSRGKSSVFDLPSDATVLDLKKSFHAKFPKFYPDRQRFSFGEGKTKVALTEDRKTLSSYFPGDAELSFKDLGPQINYKHVFLIEYFGPILFHCLFYFFPQVFYGHGNLLHKVLPQLFSASAIPAKSYTQDLIFYMVVAHFIKRELETLFVHKFSHATMPIFNLYKNCAHYWISGGLLLAFSTYHPHAHVVTNPLIVAACTALFLFAEVSNLMTHLNLSSLRRPGSTERKIPRGYGFDLVSCPNYFFEILAWLSVAILAPSFSSIFFWISGAGQMWLWAVKKHKAYKKDFKDYPKRKVMVPFLF